MSIVDTHSHLYLENFQEDLDKVIERIHENKISKVLLPNIDRESVIPLLKLYGSNTSLFSPMMGLHPTSVNTNFQKDLEFILKEKNLKNICAIGEIGLDYYWSEEFKEQQKEAFQYQIDFAKKMGLPIAVHCRNAFEDILAILEKNQDKTLKGVLHCFTGNEEQADRLIKIGFYLGIGGVLTYKNSGLDKTLKNINVEHLVLETDAPFLSPVPFRGKRNESSYTIYVAKKLAEIKNISLEELMNTTTANAIELFNLEM